MLKCSFDEFVWEKVVSLSHSSAILAPPSKICKYFIKEAPAAMAQEQPRGATQHPRSGAVAERSYPMPEVRGGG